MKPITLEYRQQRMYYWMRKAAQVHTEKMGINASTERSLRIKRIAQKALRYYQDALPVETTKKHGKKARMKKLS